MDISVVANVAQVDVINSQVTDLRQSLEFKMVI